MRRADWSGERLLPIVSPLLLLAVWQALLMAGVADRRFVPAPTDVMVQFWRMLASGELVEHSWATLYRATAGFLLGSVPGIALGLLMAVSRPIRLCVDPLIAALFPIPKIALMPLILLLFGFGDASKIVLVALATVFPVAINTYAGAAHLDVIYLDVARSFGASRPMLFRRVLFFGALPMIFAGLRIALSVSFVILVAAEFVATRTGLGYLIWNSWELLQVDVMFVGIVAVGLLGMTATAVLREVERRVIPWKTV